MSRQPDRATQAAERFDRRLEQMLRRESARFFWMTLCGVAALHSMLFMALYATR